MTLRTASFRARAERGLESLATRSEYLVSASMRIGAVQQRGGDENRRARRALDGKIAREHRPVGPLMRILFIAWRDLSNPLAGGSEVLIDRLATGLQQRGHDVALLCAKPTTLHDYTVVENGTKFSQFLRTPLSYHREFLDRDLVVDVANGMAFYSPIWRRRPTICLVNHVHDQQWNQWFAPPLATLGRVLERRAMPNVYRNHLFVAVSPSTASALEAIGVDPDLIRIVPNGVELPQEVAPKASEPTFLALGRLVPHKRIDLMLRAWKQVHPRTGGRLVVAGEGPELEHLESIGAPAVEFVGRVTEDQKSQLLGEAWLLVHPSMLEGWGLVIMEAAAHGTPTLGFRAPGVRDSVVNRETGILVDSETELIQQWIELATNDRLRANLAAGAERRARDFGWSRTVDRFERVADEAITLHRAPALRASGDFLRSSDAQVVRRIDALVGADAGVRRLQPWSSISKVDRYTRSGGVRPIDLSIVIPALDETDRLPDGLGRLFAHVEPSSTEVIVVDDGSTDNTARVAAHHLEPFPHHSVVQLTVNRGKGAAVKAGVARARGRSIVFMDADMATDLNCLPSLLAALENAHIAIGSRAAPEAEITGATFMREMGGRSFNRIVRSVTPLRFLDTQCGFKAFRASTAKLLFHLSSIQGLAFDVELLALAQRIGYQIAEVPVRWDMVAGGKINMMTDPFAMTRDVISTRRKLRPSRVLAYLMLARDEDESLDDLAHEVRRNLRVSNTVLPWQSGVLALLPCAEPAVAERLSQRLRDRMERIEVEASACNPATLLHVSAAPLRRALVAR